MKLIIDEVINGDDTYYALFVVETGEKIAPWADSDTPDEVLEKLRNGNQ